MAVIPAHTADMVHPPLPHSPRATSTMTSAGTTTASGIRRLRTSMITTGTATTSSTASAIASPARQTVGSARSTTAPYERGPHAWRAHRAVMRASMLQRT